MRYVYLDASSGISGDMCLGALLDLGVEPARFRRAMAGLRLPVEIRVDEVRRGGLRGLKVDVEVKGSLLHSAPSRANGGVKGRVRRTPHEHGHDHDRRDAGGRSRLEHEHHDEHGHEKSRTFADVCAVLGRAGLGEAVADRAVGVFRNLFAAEAKVHGRPFAKTHLHEAGADDALVDIAGTCWLLAELRVERVLCSPLNVGSGFVEAAHGLLPVPPPAVAELLKGVPVYASGPEAELVTPTGAALAKTLASSFLRLPELVYDRVGCGAGGRDLPGTANLLRAFAGDSPAFDPDRQVVVVEAAIDDATPQLLAHFLETALALGALDATLEPVVMKKGRLGSKLTLLAETDRMNALVDAVFRETPSIGVRWYPVGRRVLDRRRVEVKVGRATVGLKVSSRDGADLTIQPEYEDVRRAAEATGLPVKEVLRRAAAAYGSGAGPAGGDRRSTWTRRRSKRA